MITLKEHKKQPAIVAELIANMGEPLDGYDIIETVSEYIIPDSLNDNPLRPKRTEIAWRILRNLIDAGHVDYDLKNFQIRYFITPAGVNAYLTM